MVRWLCVVCLSLALVGSSAGAQQVPIAPAHLQEELTAIGYITLRRPVPGSGEGVRGCTATLVAPQLVLTAAHCVVRRADRPESLFITFGWTNTVPLWRGTAARVTLHPGYVFRSRDIADLHGDLALIELPRPVPAELVTPIPFDPFLVDTPPPDPGPIAIYGFERGVPSILLGHSACDMASVRPQLLATDCTVVSGLSGAPILVDRGDGLRVAAVAVARLPGQPQGFNSLAAVPVARMFPDDRYPDLPAAAATSAEDG